LSYNYSILPHGLQFHNIYHSVSISGKHTENYSMHLFKGVDVPKSKVMQYIVTLPRHQLWTVFKQ